MSGSQLGSSDATKVLVVTGGLFDGGASGMPADRSVSWWWSALTTQLQVLGASRRATALALHSKLTYAEPALFRSLENRANAPAGSRAGAGEGPEDRYVSVTEVLLATLLAREGMAFEVVTITELLARGPRIRRLLRECAAVFVSSTLLLDRTEVELVTRFVKRPWNQVVLGGTLAAELARAWRPLSSLDVVAVGYGELLVPSLAEWIRSGFERLDPPPGGRSRRVGDNHLVYSGTPSSRSLDELPSPDWGLAVRTHGRRIRTAGYESVRGCPYRCAYCDFPFLFDDATFRMRSADKIAEDWERMAEEGVEEIVCLDSLFTTPRRRLIRLCELLMERKVPITWACYARADDLDNPDVPRLMARAGCVSVNMGIESGSQRILDNMNKRTTVAANSAGIRNARAAGIRVSANFIVGYPGETAETVRETLEFILANRPDTFNVFPLNLGTTLAPMAGEESRRRFGLETHYDGSVQNPHWRHDTMSVIEAIDWVYWLRHEVIRRGAAADQGVASLCGVDRDEALAYQARAATGRPLLRERSSLPLAPQGARTP
jgi:anaerobic magnesium-protoporphyrin IX monomethyl ester cyclase